MRAAFVAALLLLPLSAGCVGAALENGATLSQGEPLVEAVTDEPGWAPIEEATIRPGVTLLAKDGYCSSNFIFVRPDGTNTFLGTTANCVRGMAVGEFVVIDPGRTDAVGMLIYSSWITMDEIGTDDAGARQYNDFAVIRIEPKFLPFVHPAMLTVGGPTRLGDADSVATMDTLMTYGAPFDDSTPDLGPSHSYVQGHDGDWGILTRGAPPMLPGHLGTGMLTPDGAAVGIVVSFGVLPNPLANGVARLDQLMSYASEHANLNMELATWDLIAS